MSQLDPARISTVYDVTLVAGSENSAPPTLTSAIRGKETVANMYIRKFDLKDIPKDEEGSSAWLMKLFQVWKSQGYSSTKFCSETWWTNQNQKQGKFIKISFFHTFRFWFWEPNVLILQYLVDILPLGGFDPEIS